MLRNLRKGKPLPPVDDMPIGAMMRMWRQAKAKIEKANNTIKKGINYSTFVQVHRLIYLVLMEKKKKKFHIFCYANIWRNCCESIFLFCRL